MLKKLLNACAVAESFVTISGGEIYARNHMIEYCTPTDSDLDISLDKERLLKALRNIKGEFKLLASGTITSGRQRFKIPVLADRSPRMKREEGFTEITLADTEKVQRSAGKKDVRYFLNGLHIDGENIVATDGHRLSVTRNETNKVDIIIPTEFYKYLEPTVFVSDSQVVSGDYTCQLIGGKFPDYKRVIPNIDQYIVVDKEALKSALTGAITAETFVDLAAGEDLEVFNDGFEDVLSIENPFAINVRARYNIKYIEDALATIDDSKVYLYIEEDRPLLVKEGDTTHVVMPMRR